MRGEGGEGGDEGEALGGEVLDVVVGAVEGGADELREAGIEDDELLLLAVLHIEDLGDEGAHLPDHGSTEFEVKLLAVAQL